MTIKTQSLDATSDGIATAAQILRKGGLVGFATETVYGLGGDARDDRAVARIFEAKGRPHFNPLIVHVPDLEAACYLPLTGATELHWQRMSILARAWLVSGRHDRVLIGMVEPLGFEICALRYKAEAVEGIEAVGGKGRFKLVHDTFHHTLAHGGPLFPDHTGIVHVSGVVDQEVGINDMRDPHRVLVTKGDRLGNVEQIAALQAAGWSGPVSFEAFSPEIHALADPASALRASMDLIAQVDG